MKKMVLNKLDTYKLSSEEKKQVKGGSIDLEIFDPPDCTPRGCECINGYIRCK